MPARRNRRRAPRRKARKGRSRVPRSIRPRAESKVHNFTFNLPPQYINGVTGTSPPFAVAGPAPTRPLKNNASFVTTAAGGNPIANVYDWFVATSHSLDDCQDYTLFTPAFKQYKINSVSCTIENVYQNTSQQASLGTMPTLYWYNDTNDAIVDLNMTQFAGRGGVKIRQFSADKTKFTFKFKPVVNPLIYQKTGSDDPAPVVTAALVANKSMWLNTLYPGVPHFSTKMAFADVYQGSGAGYIPVFRILWKYNISFKQTRGLY